MTDPALPLRVQRLRVIAGGRRLIAERATSFAAAASRPHASPADIMVAEVMPLLAACRFLERRAIRILGLTRPGGRPLWLWGTRLLVRRVPLGRVLVIGPANYPLLLPGVQVLQALAAGNQVLVKPAPGCAAPMHALRSVLVEAGLPAPALSVLDDESAAAGAAIEAGVDHVVLTGSAETGRAVLADLAPRLVPATMELSGRDAMLVLDGADVELAALAASFGLRFNGGRTCIAPRRIIVVAAMAERFAGRLRAVLATAAPVPVAAALRGRIAAIAGTDALCGGGMRPLAVAATKGEAWVDEDLFAPLAALLTVPDEAAAIAAANAGPYALGATVFGPGPAAWRVAGSLRAGCVLVNDMVAPTAHPGLPFGGAGASGFGVTRGAEGLLAMTRPQAVVERTSRSVRHLTTLPPQAADLVAALLQLGYGGSRWRAVAGLARGFVRLQRRPRQPSPEGG